MRQTFFGPLIKDVETRIKAHQGERWDRALFENHLMGYAMRTDTHRFIAWRDHRKPSAPPLFTELYDLTQDPHETVNIASENPELVKELKYLMYAQLKAKPKK